jgi:DNA-binding NarL/FixJ family response regulator
MARTIGVVLVDPLPIVRIGLGLLLSSEPDIGVVEEASSADECLAAMKRQRRRSPTLVLVGLGLGGERDAYWLIERLRREFPTQRILAVGAHSDAGAVSRSLFVGADGFLDKGCESMQFVAALRSAAQGELVLAGVNDNDLGRIARSIARQRSSDFILTAREQEVIRVAAEGLTARQIGTRLGLCERTVTTHLTRIYDKLGVNSRVGAIGEAARRGLVTVGARN